MNIGFLPGTPKRPRKRARLDEKDKKQREDEVNKFMFQKCHGEMLLALYGSEDANFRRHLEQTLELYQKCSTEMPEKRKLVMESLCTISKFKLMRLKDRADEFKVPASFAVTMASSHVKALNAELQIRQFQLRKEFEPLNVELRRLYTFLVHSSDEKEKEEEVNKARKRCLLLRMLYRSIARLAFQNIYFDDDDKGDYESDE